MPSTNPNNKFVFTLHHWTPTDWEYIQHLCETNDKITYVKVAQEGGKDGDTSHLQGCIILTKNAPKMRPTGISKLLMGPNKDIAKPNPKKPGKFLKHHYHVDGMRGSYEEAASYCGDIAKEGIVPIFEYGEIPKITQGSRTDHEQALVIIKKHAEEGGTFEELEELLPKFADQSSKWLHKQFAKYRKFGTNFFDTHEPYEWQKEWYEYLKLPADKREIVFLVDEEGNAGKTEFFKNAKHMIPDKKIQLMSPKDPKSLSSLLYDDGADIILIDAPRSVQYDLPYSWLEEVKNGFVTNTKYEVCVKQFATPHVLVFMNRYPKVGVTILSEDRYLIVPVKLTEEELTSRKTARTVSRNPISLKHKPRSDEILAEIKQNRADKESERMAKRDRSPSFNRIHNWD